MPQTSTLRNTTGARSKPQTNATSTAPPQSSRCRPHGKALPPSGAHSPPVRRPAVEHRLGNQVRSEASVSATSSPPAAQGSLAARQRQVSVPTLPSMSLAQHSAAVLASQQGVAVGQGPTQGVELTAAHSVLACAMSSVSKLPLGHSQSQVLITRDSSPGARVCSSARSARGCVGVHLAPPPPLSVQQQQQRQQQQQQREPSPGNFLLQVPVERGVPHGRAMSPRPGQSQAGVKYFDLTELDLQVPAYSCDPERTSPRLCGSWTMCSRSPSPTSHQVPHCVVQVPAPDGCSTLDASTDPLQRSALRMPKTVRIVAPHPQLNTLDLESFPALSALRHHCEEQLRQQRELISAIASQWEQRFLQLEQGLQAVNDGLQTSTTMTSTINERSAKFLRLGETVETLMAERQEANVLSEAIRTLENDVANMGRELAIEKEERLKLVEDVCCQAEGQVAAINKLVEAEKKRMRSEDADPAFSGGGTEVLVKLSRDTAEMREQLHSTSDHVKRLAKEVDVVQQELRHCTFNRSGSGDLFGKGALGNRGESPHACTDVFRRDTGAKLAVSSSDVTTALSSSSTVSLADSKSNSLG